MELTSPHKARAGDKVAVVSPSYAAPRSPRPSASRRFSDSRPLRGLVSVEFPAIRKLGASARERVDDLNAAFADPEMRA